MKTLIKKWAALGVVAVGFMGCSPSNDVDSMKGADGKVQSGVTPPTVIKDPKKFAEANKSPITDNEKYKNDIKH